MNYAYSINRVSRNGSLVANLRFAMVRPFARKGPL